MTKGKRVKAKDSTTPLGLPLQLEGHLTHGHGLCQEWTRVRAGLVVAAVTPPQPRPALPQRPPSHSLTLATISITVLAAPHLGFGPLSTSWRSYRASEVTIRLGFICTIPKERESGYTAWAGHRSIVNKMGECQQHAKSTENSCHVSSRRSYHTQASKMLLFPTSFIFWGILSSVTLISGGNVKVAGIIGTLIKKMPGSECVVVEGSWYVVFMPLWRGDFVQLFLY